LSHAQERDQVVHGALAARQQIQDPPPPGLRHRVEHVRRRRRSSHGDIIFPYRNISTQIVCVAPIEGGGRLASVAAGTLSIREPREAKLWPSRIRTWRST
jgi:hypothetical protein